MFRFKKLSSGSLLSVFTVSAYCQCLLSVLTVSAYCQCLLSVLDVSACCQCLLSVLTVSVCCQCLLSVLTVSASLKLQLLKQSFKTRRSGTEFWVWLLIYPVLTVCVFSARCRARLNTVLFWRLNTVVSGGLSRARSISIFTHLYRILLYNVCTSLQRNSPEHSIAVYCPRDVQCHAWNRYWGKYRN
jgi:hypothetical protein